MIDRTMTVGPSAGLSTREDGVGGRELIKSADVGQTALAAAAEAEVKARYVMARHNPRNDDTARILMLRACARPAFAELAIYSRPVGGGKKAEGLSIRFAEEARRAWGNMHTSADVIYDDDEKQIVVVSSTDLEANITERVSCVLPKTMERKQLKPGEIPIRSRVNSSGELVYVLPADDGALRTQRKAEEAKARRQTILALIPADILDDAKKAIYATQKRRDAEDPAAAKKRILDTFAELGIMPDQIEERYLGHAIEQTTPDELVELRAVFVALKSEGITWADACAAKHGSTGDEKLDAAATEARGKIAEKKTKLQERAAPKAKAQAQAAPPTQTTTSAQAAGAQALSDEQRAAAIDRGEPGSDG